MPANDTVLAQLNCANEVRRRKLQLYCYLRRRVWSKRRARDSNPQPVTRHDISSACTMCRSGGHLAEFRGFRFLQCLMAPRNSCSGARFG